MHTVAFLYTPPKPTLLYRVRRRKLAVFYGEIKNAISFAKSYSPLGLSAVLNYYDISVAHLCWATVVWAHKSTELKKHTLKSP